MILVDDLGGVMELVLVICEHGVVGIDDFVWGVEFECVFVCLVLREVLELCWVRVVAEQLFFDFGVDVDEFEFVEALG